MRRSCNIYTPTFISSTPSPPLIYFGKNKIFFSFLSSCVEWTFLLVQRVELYIYILFSVVFVTIAPVCRNVYAILMNCFSARIPTELKLFNFPYFLLLILLYSVYLFHSLLIYAFQIDFLPYALSQILFKLYVHVPIVFSLRYRLIFIFLHTKKFRCKILINFIFKI